jgi:hypothetical protein
LLFFPEYAGGWMRWDRGRQHSPGHPAPSNASLPIIGGFPHDPVYSYRY